MRARMCLCVVCVDAIASLLCSSTVNIMLSLYIMRYYGLRFVCHYYCFVVIFYCYYYFHKFFSSPSTIVFGVSSFVWSIMMLPYTRWTYFSTHTCCENQANRFLFFLSCLLHSSSVTIQWRKKNGIRLEINLIQIHLFTTYYLVNVTDASFGFTVAAAAAAVFSRLLYCFRSPFSIFFECYTWQNDVTMMRRRKQQAIYDHCIRYETRMVEKMKFGVSENLFGWKITYHCDRHSDT